ncbi:short-chain type dehydrogenase/reductase [Metapseudomonas resinovorans]|jgi:NAD(P)-dependent dehydrogenase (short-subunit alcohol dehydrogenase family)|uniref:SDR family NAD(P)-dependent oxidoreductase n=1 Tax=Metapseudomonas resinovorans TaxID=53412 RepID=UPI000986DC2B|nr:SDR family NAD(P)-dependent oxidoreductase [Pseudomonas resinovorans]GLZ84422.1 short-chain type dehydrogenase/reductase [Pseudomonas resinovorans]
MREFANKTVVITGAASGLGLAMARTFQREGMRVVLGDLPGPELEVARDSLARLGGEVLAIPVDVSDAESVEDLARQVDAVGGLDILCNNAGITGDRPRNSWEHDLGNWRRVLDVNLMGVIHGLHSFVPRLLRQGRAAHIVNTASMGGLMAIPFIAPYVAAKSALVALSESLALELASEGTSIGVSVLCPGLVRTGLTGPGRDHSLSRAPEPSAAALAFQQGTQQALEKAALSAEDVAEALLAAIREDHFYVLTHEGSLALAGQRWQRLVGQYPSGV